MFPQSDSFGLFAVHKPLCCQFNKFEVINNNGVCWIKTNYLNKACRLRTFISIHKSVKKEWQMFVWKITLDMNISRIQLHEDVQYIVHLQSEEVWVWNTERGEWRLLLPEVLCGAEDFTSGAIDRSAITTESSVGYSITGPRQRALERTAQVVKCPCYNDIIVETHQCRHAQHPDADTCEKTQSLNCLTQDKLLYGAYCMRNSLDYFMNTF